MNPGGVTNPKDDKIIKLFHNIGFNQLITHNK